MALESTEPPAVLFLKGQLLPRDLGRRWWVNNVGRKRTKASAES